MNQFYIKIATTFIFLAGFYTVSAQNDWQSAGTLYSDSYVKVELEYKLSSTICTGNTKPSRFRYIVSGSSRGFDYYVNWKMDYDDCNGKVMQLTNNLQVGNLASDGPIESMDWYFAGATVASKFHTVSGATQPDNTPPKEINQRLVQPSSITGNTLINYGDNTNLSVQGGSLSKGGKWAWYEGGCGVNLIGSGTSLIITVHPQINTTYYVRGEDANGNTSCASITVRVNEDSDPATSVKSRRFSCNGDKRIELSVVGGRLGKGAKWVWYADGCGDKRLAEGTTVTVLPVQRTAYYVRAEGASNNTACQTASIDPDNIISAAPSGINGAGTICDGQTVALRVSGGRLAFDQEWVWYRGSIASGNRVGTGENLSASPLRSEVYYVQGEGGPCGSTNAASAKVIVQTASTPPQNITYDDDELYRGKKIRLRKVGGNLGTGSQWIWYKNDCANGKRIGTGETVTIRLKKTQTIYMHAEDDCNTTRCVSKRLDAKPKFFFLNMGIAANGSTDFSGIAKKPVGDSSTLVFTIGHIKKANWYLRGKLSLGGARKTTYVCNDNDLLDYNRFNTAYKFSGRVSNYRASLTAGSMYGLGNVYLYVGLGYGLRELSWEFDEYIVPSNTKISSYWAKHANRSVEGIEVEAGILVRLAMFNIMGGMSGISTVKDEVGFKYFDAHLGIGLSF